MRRYVRERKRELGLSGREVFVPQSYELGQEAQVDWFEAMAILGGEARKLQFFALCLFNTYASIAFIILVQLNFALAPRLPFLSEI